MKHILYLTTFFLVNIQLNAQDYDLTITFGDIIQVEDKVHMPVSIASDEKLIGFQLLCEHNDAIQLVGYDEEESTMTFFPEDDLVDNDTGFGMTWIGFEPIMEGSFVLIFDILEYSTAEIDNFYDLQFLDEDQNELTYELVYPMPYTLDLELTNQNIATDEDLRFPSLWTSGSIISGNHSIEGPLFLTSNNGMKYDLQYWDGGIKVPSIPAGIYYLGGQNGIIQRVAILK